MSDAEITLKWLVCVLIDLTVRAAERLSRQGGFNLLETPRCMNGAKILSVWPDSHV